MDIFRKSENLNFLVYPDQGKGISFKISKILLYTLVGIAGFLAVAFYIFITSFVEISNRAFLAESLLKENQRLRLYNAKVIEMEKELLRYRDLSLKIAQLAGIEGISFERSSLWKTGTFLAKDSLVKIEKPEEVLLAQDLGEGLAKEDSIPYGLPLEGWISKGFIEDPKSLGGAHPGIDIAAPEGKEVRATAFGVVEFAGWDDYYGNLIIIDHKNGFETYYGHNSKLRVSKDQKVKRGEVIALSGNTGRSTAPHLHYEIKKEGMSINPENYLGKKDEKR
jgi:murein DD-endopeptidase MepM/ murein hydrolase activator NlpD